MTDPVTVKDPGDQSATEGVPVSLQPDAADADGYTAWTWTETGLPPGLTIDPDTGLITGTLAAGAAAAGPYVATVTATDAGGFSASQAVVWDVASPVTLTDPGQQSATEGGPDRLQIHETDADAAGGSVTYSAAGLPTGLTIDPGTGLISGTVSSSAAGPFEATVTAMDAAGYSGSDTIEWDVASPITVDDPGAPSVAEGGSVSLQLNAGDQDFEGNTLTYSASDLPAGLSINAAGLISGTIAAGDFVADSTPDHGDGHRRQRLRRRPDDLLGHRRPGDVHEPRRPDRDRGRPGRAATSRGPPRVPH